MTANRRTAKAKGSRSEWKVRDWYEKEGFHVVKAGGSLGMFDLVGLHPDYGVVLVQVKTNRNPGKVELDSIKAFQCHSTWRKIVAIVRDYRPIEFQEV